MEKVKAIEIAFENELKERDFYLKQSEKTNDSLGKKMFATLAQEEEEHYEYLKTLHEEMKKIGKWPEYISAEIKGTNVKKVLEEFVDKVEYSSASTADDKEAIKIAIEFEKKAHAFYTDLISKAEHPDEKTVFEQLAALEFEHATSLEETLNYFENPADWFAENEKPHFEA